MFTPNDELVSYVKRKTGLNDVKFLPQNIKKQSRPAKLVTKYGNSDPNNLIWLYSEKKRYVGMMVRKVFAVSDVNVLKWVTNRQGKYTEIGDEYIMIIF